MTYISGAMTSCPDTYRDNFRKAENYLVTLGHDVFNPSYLSDYLIESKHLKGKEFDNNNRYIFLREDLKALLNCDTIVMLPNWKVSEGAKLEKYVAEQCGIKVLYLQEDFLNDN